MASRRKTIGGPPPPEAEPNQPLVTRDHFRIGDMVWAKLRGYTWFPGIIIRIYDENNIVVMFFDSAYERNVVSVGQCRFFTPDCATLGVDLPTLLVQAKQTKQAPMAGSLAAAVKRAKEEYAKRLYFKRIGHREPFAQNSAGYVYNGPIVHGKEQLRKWHLKTFNAIISEMEQLDQQKWFRLPVEATHNVPDYRKVIRRPMDLSTMRAKVRKNEYEALEDFGADLLLIFDNCVLYNGRGSPFGIEALRLQGLAQRKLDEAQATLETIRREEAACNKTAAVLIAAFNDRARQQKAEPFLKSQALAEEAVEAAPSPPRKRRREEDEAEAHLVVPPQLRWHLGKERDQYQTTARTGVRLPKKIPVAKLMSYFERRIPCQLAVDDASRAKVSEVGRGVLKNFNDACLKCLMYPSERPVLEKYLQSLGRPTLLPDQLFGAEHLLRMVVLLPGHLQAAPLEPADRTLVYTRLNDLLSFLQANYENFFQQ